MGDAYAAGSLIIGPKLKWLQQNRLAAPILIGAWLHSRPFLLDCTATPPALGGHEASTRKPAHALCQPAVATMGQVLQTSTSAFALVNLPAALRAVRFKSLHESTTTGIHGIDRLHSPPDHLP
jgi:hypothetical protein